MPEPLSAAALAVDAAFCAGPPDATDIGRPDRGAIPASRVRRMPPHEGNLFDRRHRRCRARAFDSA